MEPVGMEGVLTSMAASVLHSASGMNQWGIADLTVGLYKLSGRHALEGAVDTITSAPVMDVREIDDVREWLQWAKAAYKRDIFTLATTMNIMEEDVVKIVGNSAVMKPAFYIVVHHRRQCVVMGIRGTNTAQDVLTDLNPHSEPFEGGYAHSGMLAAALWLLKNEGHTLQQALQAHPGYGLVLAGHSLGAGTAALLTLMLRESFPTPYGPLSKYLGIPEAMIVCWGFGCPPCVDLNLAVTSPFIYNAVLQDDVVARVSPAALEDLRSEVAQTEWSQAFKDGSTQRQVVDVLQQTVQRVSTLKMTPEVVAVFNKAKSHGYTTFMSAGSAVVSKITGLKSSKGAKGKAGAFLAFGAAAAGTLLEVASNRVSQGVTKSLSNIEEKNRKAEEQVASAAIAANAVVASPSSNNEFLRKRRLFTPGNLYHIIRHTLQPNQIKVNDPRKVRHTVMKATDPNARFSRIVLSSTMLSDHSVPAYVDALEDASQLASVRPQILEDEMPSQMVIYKDSFEDLGKGLGWLRLLDQSVEVDHYEIRN